MKLCNGMEINKIVNEYTIWNGNILILSYDNSGGAIGDDGGKLLINDYWYKLFSTEQ